METKEIEEILTKIGITEDKCTMLIDNGYSEHNISYYPELVEAIQKFVEILEIQHHKIVLQYLIEYAKKDINDISKTAPYAGGMIEMDIHLAEEYLEYLQAEQKEQMQEELRKLSDNRLD